MLLNQLMQLVQYMNIH